MKKESGIRKMKTAAMGSLLALTLAAGILVPEITAEAANERTPGNILVHKASSRRESAQLAAQEAAALEADRDLDGLQTVSTDFLEFEIPESWDEESIDIGDDEIHVYAYGKNVKGLDDIDDFSEIDVPTSVVVVAAMSTYGLSSDDFDFDISYMFDEETFADLFDEMMTSDDYDLSVQRSGRTKLGSTVRAIADDDKVHSEVYVGWGRNWMYVVMSVDVLGVTDAAETAQDIATFARQQ